MNKFIIIFFVILALGTTILVYYGFRSTVKSDIPFYSQSDPNKPIVLVDEKIYDFGKTNTKDTKEHEFLIKNVGKNDLVLSQITTSCDCTSAYIIDSSGNTSPRFNMHIQSDWKISIKPSDTVKIKAVYEPKVMPTTGSVERIISLATNDPLTSSLEFRIKAEVTK
ncbi:MAG: hypothetical protein HW405_68 [Candidatus Berkelbacteria bacterium]|nr:hypothetical protein [Candidatus Berkelbacteria bacterium]